MRVSLPRASGKADPFGLLIMAVMLAFSVTIGIQAQASAPGGRVAELPEIGCGHGCLTADVRH